MKKGGEHEGTDLQAGAGVRGDRRVRGRPGGSPRASALGMELSDTLPILTKKGLQERVAEHAKKGMNR